MERIKGVIIRSQDYSETHKIITIFSEKLGKFTAIARGAKKPKSRMAAVTQPFIYGEFLVYVNKGLSTVQQGEIINSFRSIREDIIKTAYMAYIAELTDKILSTKKPDHLLYDQFFRTMNFISENEESEIPMMMYELKLYVEGGFAPVVDRCINCGSNTNLAAFSIREGGLLCQSCRHIDEHATFVSPSIAKLLSIFIHVGLEQVGTISIKEENQLLLRKVLDEYYDQYGGYYLKSRRFLKQLDLLK